MPVEEKIRSVSQTASVIGKRLRAGDLVMVCSNVPVGTTRDAVDETVTRDGIDYVFVDTAGIRRKGKTHLMAEKMSVVMARRHLRMSHVAVLVLGCTWFAGDAQCVLGSANSCSPACMLRSCRSTEQISMRSSRPKTTAFLPASRLACFNKRSSR